MKFHCILLGHAPTNLEIVEGVDTDYRYATCRRCAIRYIYGWRPHAVTAKASSRKP